MSSYNRVILVGNLTRDPDVKTVRDTCIADLGLAVNERVKKGEQWVDEAVFVDITFFGRTAEVVKEYLRKGSQVLVEGRLKLDQWDDKTTGQKRSKLKVVGDKMQMLGSKDGGGKKQPRDSDGFYDEPAPKKTQTPAEDAEYEESIPF